MVPHKSTEVRDREGEIRIQGSRSRRSSQQRWEDASDRDPRHSNQHTIIHRVPPKTERNRASIKVDLPFRRQSECPSRETSEIIRRKHQDRTHLQRKSLQ